jgi:hypothetical protein
VELVEDLKVFAGLEANGLARGDGNFGARARIAADSGFTWLDGEDAEAAQLDAIVLAECLLHCIEDGIDGYLGLGAGKASAFHYSLDEILLDHLVVAFPVLA